MKILRIIVFMYSSINLVCAGALLRIFKQTNFKGDSYDQLSSATCTDLPEEFQISKGSLKPYGCIAIYTSTNCNDDAYGYIIKFRQPTLNNLTKEYRRATDMTEYTFKLRSLRDCTNKENASKTYLDFWKVDHQTKNTSQFKDVCGCILLPAYESLDYEYGVNTYGTCFEFYSTINCTGGPIFRISKLKASLPSLEAKSVKHCHIPIICGDLKTRVFNIAPAFNESMLIGNLNDATVDSKQTFINSGRSTIVELYSATRILSETIEYDFSRGFRELATSAHTVETVSEKTNTSVFNLSFDFLVSFPIKKVIAVVGYTFGVYRNSTETLRTAMKKAFEEQSETKYQKQKLNTIKNERRFEVRKKITLPACTKYQVSSVVEIVEGIEMEYDVQFEIRGNTTSNLRMTSEDIIFGLTQSGSKLRIITDSPRANNFTVVAESTMTVKLNVGLNSVIHGVGEIMQDCINGHNMCSCNCSQARILG